MGFDVSSWAPRLQGFHCRLLSRWVLIAPFGVPLVQRAPEENLNLGFYICEHLLTLVNICDHQSMSDAWEGFFVKNHSNYNGLRVGRAQNIWFSLASWYAAFKPLVIPRVSLVSGVASF